jgi:hypothetical protein
MADTLNKQDQLQTIAYFYANTSNASGLITVGANPADPTYGAIYFGVVPGNTNYSLLGKNGETWVNAATLLSFRISNGDVMLLSGTGIRSTVGHQMPIDTVTGAHALIGNNSTLLCNATGGAFTVTLPVAAAHPGRVFTIKKIDASVNAVTIDGDGAETIDGAATYALTAQWQSVVLQCNGTSWFVLSKNP